MNIFVGNLDFHVTEDEVRETFSPYGQVDRVKLVTDRDTGKSRGFGFVEMPNATDAQNAITGLNGSQLGGRTLNVNEAHPRPQGSGRRGEWGKRDRW
jgi:RNA recognition motif-containing protein